MGIEGDGRAHKMLALAEAGEARREHLVSPRSQDAGHRPPIPTCLERPMHQNERRHATTSRRHPA